MNEIQEAKVVLANEINKEELAKAVSEIIRKNSNVRQAIINLVCACPNVMTEI